jgi:hypothetical protein
MLVVLSARRARWRGSVSRRSPLLVRRRQRCGVLRGLVTKVMGGDRSRCQRVSVAHKRAAFGRMFGRNNDDDDSRVHPVLPPSAQPSAETPDLTRALVNRGRIHSEGVVGRVFRMHRRSLGAEPFRTIEQCNTTNFRARAQLPLLAGPTDSGSVLPLRGAGQRHQQPHARLCRSPAHRGGPTP